MTGDSVDLDELRRLSEAATSTTCPSCGYDARAHGGHLPHVNCGFTAAGIAAGRVPWTVETRDYGGETYVTRIGPLTGGDSDFGEGLGAIFCELADAAYIVALVNWHRDLLSKGEQTA